MPEIGGESGALRRITAMGGLLVCVGAAPAQLYTEDFDADHASAWVVNPHPGGMDHGADFFFDYATVGIPPAPNSAGGTTRGLRLSGNLSSGVFGGFSVSPAAGTIPDLLAAGDFVLSFDVWSNFNGPFPAGGNGSTNLSTFGVLTSGTAANYAGAADCVWFGHTGDGGSTADYRVYDPVHLTSRQDGDEAYLDQTRDAAGLTYQGLGGQSAPAAQVVLFGQQTGTTQSGAAGMAWREVTITRAGERVIWHVDGRVLAVVDIAGLSMGGGNILFGHSDINRFSSTDPAAPDLLFTLVDNVRVTADVQRGACCFADGTCEMITEGECQWEGGVFQGDGANCATAGCAVTIGACCFGNGDCFEAMNESECTAQRGAYQGAGTSCAAGCMDLVNGPDVVAAEINDIANWGEVEGVLAYSLGVFTCNVGDEDLHWGNTWNGSPVMATNAYRLHEGRLEQVGMSWAKHSCCVTVTRDGCGLCNGVNGQMLGVGCRDSYSAEYNGRQDRMGPRSAINAWTGAIPTWTMDSGNDAVYKRLQVDEADLAQAAAGAQYFVEAVYVASDEAGTPNWQNNVSYRPVNVDVATNAMTVVGSTGEHVPALLAWRDHGAGPGQPDPDVTIVTADVPGEGRFYAAAKVRESGEGLWRYEYTVFNLNSDRSGGSLTVPVPAGVAVSGIGFHDVDYHSGEVYDGTDWSIVREAGAVAWSSPQTFAENPNSNALRWGTMYNFWFDADTAPASGWVTLGLFKPGSPGSIQTSLPTPGDAACACEVDSAAGVDVFDLLAYLDLWFASVPAADIDGAAGVNVFDLLVYLDCWFPASGGIGCP